MKFKRTAALILSFALFAMPMSACSNDEITVKTPSGDASPTISDSAVSPDYVYTGSDDNYTEIARGLDENGFFIGIKATDYISLPKYKGVEVPSSVMTADETSIQTQIDAILQDNAVTENLYEGVVKDGDTVNIDYTGTIDGVPFPNGSTDGKGSTVTIGVDNFIDNMLTRLIGHSVGETFDLDARFPDDYREESLRGKDSVFNITINYIVGVSQTPTELTDEIASVYGFATAAEFEEDIKDWVVRQQQTEYFYTLFGDAEVSEIPDVVMDHVISDGLSYYYNYAEAYNVSVDEIIKQATGAESRDAYITSNFESFTSTAAFYLLIQAIAEEEQLSVSDEDIVSYGYGSYLEQYSPAYVKMYLLQEIVVPMFVFDNAIITG